MRPNKNAVQKRGRKDFKMKNSGFVSTHNRHQYTEYYGCITASSQRIGFRLCSASILWKNGKYGKENRYCLNIKGYYHLDTIESANILTPL